MSTGQATNRTRPLQETFSMHAASEKPIGRGTEGKSPAKDAFVSIIIPMRNEERFVAQCLDSVLSQLGTGRNVEVICVDGASSDRTTDIVKEYACRDSRVLLLTNPEQIVPVGMNRAIGQARGDIIIRLDCHCRYSPDYLQSCLEVLQRTGADNVGGYARAVPVHDNAVGRAIVAATTSRFGVGDSVFRVGGQEQEADTVPFGCFRRDAFDRFGLYDERLVRNQDIELNSRIRKRGGRIVFSPRIQCSYFQRSTYAGLRQQAFYNGLWNPYTAYLVGGGLRIRHFVPLGFVLATLALAVFGAIWPFMFWGLAGLWAVYLVSAAAMAAKASRAHQASLALVLLGFVQLHLAYGIGSFWGLLTAPFKFGWHHKSQPQNALPDRRE